MTEPAKPSAHDPRAEADAVLGHGLSALVLEPSPPYDDSDPAYLADDPTRAPVGGGGEVISPVANGGRTWDDIVSEQPEVASFAADRWLTSGRRLPSGVPEGFHQGRLGLHRLAVYVLSPARTEAVGKIALRQTRDGFGTPFFGPDDRQVRVQGGVLVDQRGVGADVHELTTLAAAGEALGVTVDPTLADEIDGPTPGDIDADLAVPAEVASFVADWFGFSSRALESVRAECEFQESPTRVQLWPEHFDPAFDIGDEEIGRRAAFGSSPGDHLDGGDPEPYLYVSLTTPDQVPDDRFWSEPFGAKLAFADLATAEDQQGAAVEFFHTARLLLTQ